MRVLLVAHHLPPDGSAGVERVVQSLAHGLRSFGDDVSFVTRRVTEGGPPRRLREELPDGSTHYRLAGGVRPLEEFLVHHERLEEQFIAVLAEQDPDVLHVHHLFGLSPRFIEIARDLEIPVVVSLHDYYFACPLIVLRKRSGEVCDGPEGGLECARSCFSHEEDAVVRWGVRASYFRSLLQLPNRFISPSRHMATFFEGFGLDRSRMRVVDNAVSLPRARANGNRPTPRERGRLNVGYLGTIAEHKGVHVLVEALRLAELPAAHAVVAGHVAVPGYGKQLETAAAAVPGLELDLHGTYELEDLPGLLDEIDCLVVPSQWPETFAIVVREAFVRGVPVAVARIGGLREAVDEGVNGFCFDPDRPDELAGFLRKLMRDDGLNHRLREGALATRVVSPRQHAKAVRAVYEQAIEDAARRKAPPAMEDELGFLHEAAVDVGFASA